MDPVFQDDRSSHRHLLREGPRWEVEYRSRGVRINWDWYWTYAEVVRFCDHPKWVSSLLHSKYKWSIPKLQVLLYVLSKAFIHISRRGEPFNSKLYKKELKKMISKITT